MSSNYMQQDWDLDLDQVEEIMEEDYRGLRKRDRQMQAQLARKDFRKETRRLKARRRGGV